MAYENWRVRVAFDSQPDDPFPVYTDLSSRVRDVSITRGSTAEANDDAGTAVVVLDNPDQALTPGNVNSPYYPNVRAGRKIEISETVGRWNHELYTGHLEFPEIASWAASTAAAPRAQDITYSAVDRIGRLDRDEAFLSTLAAYIMSQGAPLVGYYPLTDTSPKFFVPLVGVSNLPSGIAFHAIGDLSTYVTGASSAGPPGDDASLVQATALAAALTTNIGSGPLGQTITITGTQVLTVMSWVRVDVLHTNVVAGVATQTGVNNIFNRADNTDGSTWTSNISLGGPQVTLQGPLVKTGCWELISATANLTGNQSLRVGRNTVTGALSGAAPASASFDRGSFGGNLEGAMGHLQYLVHNSMAEADAAHAAQLAVGLYGLARQSTGQRIATVLGYAGLAAGDLDLDTGTSCMQRVSLAGKTAMQACREANATEQGLLMALGSGRIRFADRRTRYNI